MEFQDTGLPFLARLPFYIAPAIRLLSLALGLHLTTASQVAISTPSRSYLPSFLYLSQCVSR